ncbi:MAG: MATE family efflux transporter [Oscillospiraceae bacterium]|nr:MATE family efflux transporter [Oscillospiraceae bacterium]
MAKSYEMDMCSGPVLKKMLMFSLPLMASGVLQLLFNAADVIILGRFAGDNSMGAVGSTSSLINLLTNLFVGLAVGVNVVAARAHGANSKDDMHEAVHTSMLLSIISGALLAVVGFVFAPQILKLMNAAESQLPLASQYLRIYFLGTPALMVYNFGSAILRAVGDTKRPLYFLTAAGVLNVLLNILFVVAFGMDVTGVALATIISQCLSAALTVVCLTKEREEIRLSLKKLSLDKRTLISIIKVGLPAGVQGCIFSMSNVLIQSSVNLFGDITVDGNSAAQSIEGFIYMAMNTFYQAAISFTGQHVGANRYDRIPRILFCALGSVIVTGLVLGWAAFIFGHQLLSIYSDSPEVIEAGINRVRVICTTYAFCGMMDVMVGMMRGLGHSTVPMVVSLIGACGLRVLWLMTAFQLPEFHNTFTIYASYPISWALTFLAHVVCYVVIWSKLKRQLKQGETANSI